MHVRISCNPEHWRLSQHCHLQRPIFFTFISPRPCDGFLDIGLHVSVTTHNMFSIFPFVLSLLSSFFSFTCFFLFSFSPFYRPFQSCWTRPPLSALGARQVSRAAFRIPEAAMALGQPAAYNSPGLSFRLNFQRRLVRSPMFLIPTFFAASCKVQGLAILLIHSTIQRPAQRSSFRMD